MDSITKSVPNSFPKVVFPLENKTYIIRNVNYPKEDLGRIVMNFNEDKCVLYLRKSYCGLHPNWLMSEWSSRGRTVIDGEDAMYWLHKRVCPPGRQNIREVLKSHGLSSYNATVMSSHGKGICDWDDLWFEEIN